MRRERKVTLPIRILRAWSSQYCSRSTISFTQFLELSLFDIPSSYLAKDLDDSGRCRDILLVYIMLFPCMPWLQGPWLLCWRICVSLCTSCWPTVSCGGFSLSELVGVFLYHVQVLCAYAFLACMCCNLPQNLNIREFTFHQVNANLLWPGTCIFAECWSSIQPCFLGAEFWNLEGDFSVSFIEFFVERSVT